MSKEINDLIEQLNPLKPIPETPISIEIEIDDRELDEWLNDGNLTVTRFEYNYSDEFQNVQVETSRPFPYRTEDYVHSDDYIELLNDYEEVRETVDDMHIIIDKLTELLDSERELHTKERIKFQQAMEQAKVHIAKKRNWLQRLFCK